MEEVRDAGDQVVTVWRVWKWRDGKLWRNVAYSDPAGALEAVGLA
jgi:hypothetical protein